MGPVAPRGIQELLTGRVRTPRDDEPVGRAYNNDQPAR